MPSHHTFFDRRQTQLKIAASLYVLALTLTHATLPPAHVWVIAAGFSILMNGVYIIEALSQRRFWRIELAVMLILTLASSLGVALHPGFVIAAIFGHGLWDLAKHLGAGVPFFRWYTFSCCAIDVGYGSALLLYWLSL